MSLNYNKKTEGSISNKTLKLAVDIVSPVIKDVLNCSFKSCKFPKAMKMAEITPIPKIGSGQDKEDFRPISILPTVSKSFEKAMANQMSQFFDSKFSKLICFRKDHSPQHALINLSSWQTSLDKGKMVGTVLMDLSKA